MDTKHRAASLQQQSYFFMYAELGLTNMVTVY